MESGESSTVQGRALDSCDHSQLESTRNVLKTKNFQPKPNSLSYIISTIIGYGHQLIQEHLKDDNLKA